MTFGASIHALTDFEHDVRPFHEALNLVREAGCSYIMLFSHPRGPVLRPEARPEASLLNLLDSHTRTVRWAVHDAGLELAVLYSGGLEVSEEGTLAASLDLLKRARDCALSLGATHLAVNAGRAPAPGLPTEQKRDLIDRLAHICSTAMEGYTAVRLGVDLHYHSPIETVADAEYFLSQTENPVGVLLNIGHLTTCRQAGWELAARHPARLPIVGWKDHRLDAPQPVFSVQLGTGDSPLEKYAQQLKYDNVERRHIIAFEHVPFADKPRALRRSLEYLQALWGQV
ncbi:MAG TPA: hypothetical protein EYP85_06570 [Armatimonadetes bacterium]|nr:hypothetical protein [Armatimonadota bacterium]